VAVDIGGGEGPAIRVRIKFCDSIQHSQADDVVRARTVPRPKRSDALDVRNAPGHARDGCAVFVQRKPLLLLRLPVVVEVDVLVVAPREPGGRFRIGAGTDTQDTWQFNVVGCFQHPARRKRRTCQPTRLRDH
jgi:hypothetical protein